MNYSLEHAWQAYTESKPGISKKLYREICNEFNRLITEEVLFEGKKFYMGAHMSYLQIRRMKRDFKKPTINWPETNKLKKQGIKQLIYYTDPFYVKWYWNKWMCKVRNKSAFRFRATRGLKGNKTKLMEFLRSDELNYTNFPLYKNNKGDI